MRAPLLHFYEELDPQMTPDFALLRSLDHSDRWLVRVADLHHIHFTTVSALLAGSPGLVRATSAAPKTGAAWRAVLQATESFLAEFVGSTGAEHPAWQPPAGDALRVETLPASR